MTRTGQNIADRAAFTLLELLIAVSIFAVVLAAINTVFYSALKLRNKTSDMIDKSVPLEQALAIIKRDLSNLVPPNGELSGQLQTTQTTNGMAGATGPVFFCANGSMDEINPYGDIQKVSYTLVQGTNIDAGLDLVRMVSRNLLAPVQEQPVGQFLMSGVQQIAFLYYDGSQWTDSWDSTTQDPKLPRGIKVQLQLLPEQGAGNAASLHPVELVIPINVQGKTNAISQTDTAQS
jgi:type II secretion system protein J